MSASLIPDAAGGEGGHEAAKPGWRNSQALFLIEKLCFLKKCNYGTEA
jgi:hypothetical protein